MKVSFCIVLLCAVFVKTEKVNDTSTPSISSPPSSPSPSPTPTHQEPPQQEQEEEPRRQLVMREVPGSNSSQQQTISLLCSIEPPPGEHENYRPLRIWWARHEDNDPHGMEIVDDSEIKVDAKIANNTSQDKTSGEDKDYHIIHTDLDKVTSLLRISNSKEFHKARFSCTLTYNCAEFRTSCQVNDFLHKEGSVQCSTEFQMRELDIRGRSNNRIFRDVEDPSEENNEEVILLKPSHSLVIAMVVVVGLMLMVGLIKCYFRYVHRPKLIPIRDQDQRRRGVYWREQRPSSMMLEMIESACNAGQEPEEQRLEEPEEQYPGELEQRSPPLPTCRDNVWLYVESDTIQLRANQTGAVDVSAMSNPGNSNITPRAFIRSSELPFVRYSRSRNSSGINFVHSNRPDRLSENYQAPDNRPDHLPEVSQIPTDIPDLLTESVNGPTNRGPQLLVRLAANTTQPVSISEINDMELEALGDFFAPEAHWEQIQCNQAPLYGLPSYTDALAESQDAQLQNESDIDAEYLLAEQDHLHQNSVSVQHPPYESSSPPQYALLPEQYLAEQDDLHQDSVSVLPPPYYRPYIPPDVSLIPDDSYYSTRSYEEDFSDDLEDSDSGQSDAQATPGNGCGRSRQMSPPTLGIRAGSEGTGENRSMGRPGWLIGIPPPLYDDGNGN